MENTETSQSKSGQQSRPEASKSGSKKTQSGESPIDLRGSLSELSDAFKRSSSGLVEQFGQISQKAYGDLCSQAKSGAERINSEIHKSPLTAVAIALGIGALLGSSVLRRS